MVLLSLLLRPQTWCFVQLQGWGLRECGLAVGWELGWEVGMVGAGSDQPVDEETKSSVAISAKGWTREVALVCGAAWIPLVVTSMSKASRARCQNHMNQAEDCGWLGTGAGDVWVGSRGAVLPRHGGGRVWAWSLTPGRWGSVQVFQGHCAEMKEGKCTGCSMGSSYSSASERKSPEQESWELVVLPF